MAVFFAAIRQVDGLKNICVILMTLELDCGASDRDHVQTPKVVQNVVAQELTRI